MKNILIASALFLFACAHGSQSNTSSSGSYNGLGKETVPSQDFTKYAPPPLDPAIERNIRSVIDIISPGAGLLSPNGKQFFFSWKITGSFQVWSLETGREFPIQLTTGKDSTHIVDITPDGKWLVVSQDKDGAENPAIYLLSVDGLQRKTIFENPKVQSSLAFISADAKYLVYSANDEKADSYTFYKYDISTGQREKIFREDGQWFLADHSKDGRWLMAKAVTNVYREYYDFNPKTKALTPVLGQEEKDDYDAIYAANEHDLIVSTSKFGEFKKLYLYKNKKWIDIFSPKTGDVARVHTDEQRRHFYITTIENGYFKAYVLDAKTLGPKRMPKFPEAENISIGTTTWDAGTTMFSVSSYNNPLTSYAYNWSTGALKQWVFPSIPGVDLKKFVPAKLEYYTAHDGTKIPMFVRRPSKCESEACPVVVQFHGGPESLAFPGFSPYAQLYVNEGFIFVEPNVRGSDGYGKTWLHADDQAKRLQVITDIEDCAKYIRSNWKITKIGVTGGSYGGYSTLIAMTKFAGAYDAGVSRVGMSNLVTFLENTAPYRRALRTPEYGDLTKDHDTLVALSPITYLDNVKSPLMITQGANDPRVPVGEALQIQKQLEKKSIPSSLIIFPDEGHGSEKKSNQILEIGHTLEFFKKYLN